jgi:hypothetical protein
MTCEFGYGILKQSESIIKQFDQTSWWKKVVDLCEHPASIDSRIESVLHVLLEDSEFNKSWNTVNAFYGNRPSIHLTNEALSNLKHPLADLPVRTNSGDTLRVLRPPIIECCERLFPAVATLSLVHHIFTLHINSIDEQINQERKDIRIALKVMAWTLRSRFPGGALDLAVAAEKDEQVVLTLSTQHKIRLLYETGKKGVSSVIGEPLETFFMAAIAQPNNLMKTIDNLIVDCKIVTT